MAAGSGKMKCLPHWPGRVPSPNSPPATLVPYHSKAPGAEVGPVPLLLVVRVDVWIVVGLALEVVVVVTGGGGGPEPGRHWEYQALPTVQVYPATQVVGPVHP